MAGSGGNGLARPSGTMLNNRSDHSSAFPVKLSLLSASLFLGLFFFLPLILVFGVSLASRGMYGGITWIPTWENYQRVFDPLVGVIFFRSLLLAGLTTFICAVVGFPLAYCLARASRPWQLILLTLVMIPFWTNFLVRTYAWVLILRADGIVNGLLIRLGLLDEPLSLLFTDLSVFLGLVYGYLPFMVLPLVVAIERISPQLEDAAFDLYASMVGMFRHVLLPLSTPGFLAGGVLVFIPSLGAFITPYLLGGGQNMMLGTFIQQEFLVARDWPFGSALSFGLMGTVLLLWFLLGRTSVEKDPS
ncbi:ABC transporter permease [Candidatus Nitrospira allomarina]|uniref:ABC transporter permease n=1 Tax=Candidatus Nitrospira allomarina TaxID=3020900 RepID=A0AA96GF08_9BACT|nr:ABC transporter permease [Candidatus Nitrospira allomarina]WNM57663.1 ABC transporter permease [Candidatus Nitrospira allomarina]